MILLGLRLLCTNTIGTRTGIGSRKSSNICTITYKHFATANPTILSDQSQVTIGQFLAQRRRRIIKTMSPHANEEVVDLTDSPPPRNASWLPPQHQQATENEDDEDLKLAIAMSLQQQEQDKSTSKSRNDHSSPVTEKVPQAPESKNENLEQPSTSGFVGLDRKAMEAERLARLKRKREPEDASAPATLREPRISPPPLRRNVEPSTTAKSEKHTVTVSAKPPMAAAKESSATQAPSSSTTRTYPKGKVLKTYCPGYPTDDTISFADLIAPASQLQSCLLSSFIWEYDWLFPHFSTKTTNFLLVMHAKYPSQKSQITADFAGIPNIKLCFPSLEGQVNCMHSKLMLLFYAERCRIVVPTANLMGFDWGVGSVMENMLWLIDLPLLSDGVEQTQTEFKQSMVAFLKGQNVPESVIGKLNGYDFANTQDTRFVHSIGGSHGEGTWQDTGHCGLGKAVSSLGLATTEPIEGRLCHLLRRQFERRIHAIHLPCLPRRRWAYRADSAQCKDIPCKADRWIQQGACAEKCGKGLGIPLSLLFP